MNGRAKSQRRQETEQPETAAQAVNRARMALSTMPDNAATRELRSAVQQLANQVNALTEAVIISMEREAIAQAHRAMAEHEVTALKAEALKRGRQYLVMLMARELDMDATMIDLVMRWFDGDAPADVSPFFVNQLRESIRELRDVIAAERSEGFDIDEM